MIMFMMRLLIIMTLIIPNMDEGKKICEIKGCDGGGFVIWIMVS